MQDAKRMTIAYALASSLVLGALAGCGQQSTGPLSSTESEDIAATTTAQSQTSAKATRAVKATKKSKKKSRVLPQTGRHDLRASKSSVPRS